MPLGSRSRDASRRRSALAFGIAFGFLGASACKRRDRTEPPGPVVRSVEIEGNDALSDEELTSYLNLQPTPAITFRAKNHYIPGLEGVDRRRIVETYAAHGHYDAEVEQLDVRVERTDRPIKKQRAHVSITVREGPPTVIQDVQVSWAEGTPVDLDRSAVEALIKTKKGATFAISELVDSREGMRLALEQQGHALAEVEERAEVDRRRRTATVAYTLVPGPRVDIGRIDIAGLDHVPEYLVRREISDHVGKRFSPTRLRRIESEIYALGVFSTVSIETTNVTDDAKIGLRITVSESKLQRLRVGIGLGIDPLRWVQYGVLHYRHENIFGHLTRLDIRNKVGYAELDPIPTLAGHGPIAEVEFALRKKGLLEKRLIWTESPSFELGIWEGYQFYSVSNRLGVARFFGRYVETGASYNNRFVDFFNLTEALERNRTLLGRDFRDPYLLSFVELRTVLHFTDDIFEPKNGVRLITTYDVAYRYLGSQFDHHRFAPDLRLYWRPVPRLQLAGRTRVGFIFPFGANPAAPFDRQFYLGGANDGRGWGPRRLAPRIEDCDPEGNCTSIPIGGKTMVHHSAEVRVRTWRELWLAAFAEAGDVRGGVAEFDARGWMYSTGGGVRYHTPVGAFRLDVGVRLNDDDRFPERRIWALHFGLGEAF